MPDTDNAALGFDAIDVSTAPSMRAAILAKQKDLLDEARERFLVWMDCNNVVMEENGIIHTGNDPAAGYATFGERLGLLFKKKNVKVVPLAARMAVRPSTVYSWLNDRCMPTLAMLRRLSAKSGISLAALLEIMDERGVSDGKGAF